MKQDASLRTLFDQARALDASAREAFVAAHCAQPLRAALQRLLLADAGDDDGVLARDPARLAEALGDDDPAPVFTPGQRIGDWELAAPLGEGGSSIVFRATRSSEGVQQQAALKLLRRALYTTEAQRAFRRERLALTQLEHAGIARLIEGGVTATGVAYLALEFVDGQPITTYVREQRLDLRARLLLFLQVCRPVDAAHRALIVHRDLKPSNVLVTRDGHIKLLDFGIAKLLDAEDDTHTQLPIFTPAYAAPEQRNGGLITTATDVHALGVLLGELVTGRRLNDGSSKTPSQRIEDDTEPGMLPATSQLTRKLVRGDLDNILLKALADEPERRYASAGALADDIERLLDHRPVAAHPPTRRYRASKFIRRHRGGVAITALFVVAVLTSLAIALWQATIARREAARANTVRDFVERIFEPVSEGVAEGKMPTLRDLVATSVTRLKANTDLGPAERVDLTLLFAGLTNSVGEGVRAGELADEAARLAAASLTPRDPLAIRALIKRGALAVRGGDYATGEPALREAERRLRADRGNDAQLADVLDNLAIVELDRGHTEAALKFERDALDARVRAFGPQARETATGYNNLGYGLEAAGRFDEAASAYQRSYEIDLKYREPESYPVLGGLANWGSALERAGHVARARDLFARALLGMEKIGGKPRLTKIVTAQKLCAADTMLFDTAAAARDCARMFAIDAEASGQAAAVHADSLRMETRRLLAAGRLGEAREMARRALDAYGDARESLTRRGLLLGTRAEIAWLEADAAAARDDALAARALTAAHRNSSVGIAADGLTALACAAAPSAACPADIDSTFAAEVERNAANPHPRMLLAWTALARRQLARGDAAHALATLDRGIESIRGEVGNDNALLRTALAWRSVALAAQGRCTEAAEASQAAAAGEAATRYPWFVEAWSSVERDRNCPLARR
jgi:serine/threonine-protein kinase